MNYYSEIKNELINNEITKRVLINNEITKRVKDYSRD